VVRDLVAFQIRERETVLAQRHKKRVQTNTSLQIEILDSWTMTKLEEDGERDAHLVKVVRTWQDSQLAAWMVVV
jgi:hypothetical protein